MYNFIIAAEGQTDIDALQVILQGLTTELELECAFPAVIFPSGDATSGRGWSALKVTCEKFRGEIKSEEQMAKDRTTFEKMGFNITPPSQNSQPSWRAVTAFQENPILVFHLDGDIAEELTAHHPKGAFEAAKDRGQYCREALQHWTGLKENDALWCVPVQCLETWFLTLHSLDDCQKHLPAMQDYESVKNSDVYNALICLGAQPYSDAEGQQTVDKVLLTQNKSEELAKNFAHCKKQCPSAERFAQDVRKILQ